MKRIVTFLILVLAITYAQGPVLDAEVSNAKKTFRKAKTNKVLISDFAVILATFNSQGKTARSGSSVSVNVWLKNLDQNAMQQVTDAVYEQFLNDLQARGYTIVPGEELKHTRAGKKFTLVTGGGAPVPIVEKNRKQGIHNEYLVFTPSGLTYLSDGREQNGANKIGVRTSVKMSQAYEELDVMAIGVTFKMDIVDFTTKGGLFRQTASVSARPALNGMDLNTLTLNFVHKYVPGMITVFLQDRYVSPTDLTGEMVETKSSEFLGSSFANYDFTSDNIIDATREYVTTLETAFLDRMTEELEQAGKK